MFKEFLIEIPIAEKEITNLKRTKLQTIKDNTEIRMSVWRLFQYLSRSLILVEGKIVKGASYIK